MNEREDGRDGAVKKTGTIANILGAFELGREVFAEVVPDETYEVIIPKDIRAGLESGRYHFTERRDGTGPMAQVRHIDDRGRDSILCNLTMRKQEKGMVPEARMEVAGYFQNLALQGQLMALNEKADEILQATRSLEAGQESFRYGQIAGAVDSLHDALSVEDEQLRKGLLADAAGKINEGAKNIEWTIRHHLASLKPIPQNDLAIKVRILMDPAYRDKTDREFDRIQSWFDLLAGAREMAAVAYFLVGEKKVAELALARLDDFVSQLDVGWMLKFRALHPGHDFSGEWFVDKPAFLESERSKVRLLSEGDGTVEIQVTGKQLLEATQHAEDE